MEYAAVQVNGKSLEVPIGSLLSGILPRDSVETPCGGHGSCGKCRVTAHGMLSGPSPEELMHLTPRELAAGVRLAWEMGHL